MDNRAIKVSLQFLICTYISTINKTRGFYEIRCLRPKGCVFANRVKYGMWDMLKLLKLPFALKTYFIPHHQLYENWKINENVIERQKLLFYSNSWVMTFLWSQALHHHISYSIFIWHVTEIKFIKHKRVMTLSNNNHVVRIEKHKKWGFRGFGCLLFKSCTHHLHYSHMIMSGDALQKRRSF